MDTFQITRNLENISASQLNDILVPRLPDFNKCQPDGKIIEGFGVMVKILKSEIMEGFKLVPSKNGGNPLKLFSVNLRLPRLQGAKSKSLALTLWAECAETFYEHMKNDVNGSGTERDYIIYQWEMRTPWKLYKPSKSLLQWHDGAVATLTYTRGLGVFIDIAVPSIYDFDETTERFVFEEAPDLEVEHPDRWDLDILDEGNIVADFRTRMSPKKTCIFKIRTCDSKRARIQKTNTSDEQDTETTLASNTNTTVNPQPEVPYYTSSSVNAGPLLPALAQAASAANKKNNGGKK
jgi:hypothetical protein